MASEHCGCKVVCQHISFYVYTGLLKAFASDSSDR